MISHGSVGGKAAFCLTVATLLVAVHLAGCLGGDESGDTGPADLADDVDGTGNGTGPDGTEDLTEPQSTGDITDHPNGPTSPQSTGNNTVPGDDPIGGNNSNIEPLPLPRALELGPGELERLTIFNITWSRYDVFTSGGGETGCCFLDGNVLVVSRNGGFGTHEAKILQFRFFYPDGSIVTFNRSANIDAGEEPFYGSYALASGPRFDGPAKRMILSNGFYCDGDPMNPESTYGRSSNWQYDERYKHGNVHGWSSFSLIGKDMDLSGGFDEQDVLGPNNITFSVAYGNVPEGHTLSLGRFRETAETHDLAGIGATWPSIAGGTDLNPIVVTWMSDDGGVEMLVAHSY